MSDAWFPLPNNHYAYPNGIKKLLTIDDKTWACIDSPAGCVYCRVAYLCYEFIEAYRKYTECENNSKDAIEKLKERLPTCPLREEPKRQKRGLSGLEDGSSWR